VTRVDGEDASDRHPRRPAMLMQIVKFESTLPEEEALRRADERADRYRAVPGLVEKYYLRYDEPNHWAGVLIWETKEAMAAFRDSELFRTVPEAYGVKGAPTIELVEIFAVLRGSADRP
jgi:heme-degrading monooxygenase HmoA